MNASRGNRPRWTWALLLIALVLAVGHVCALPGHSHAATAQHDHDADSDTSVHGASCDAIAALSAPVTSCPPALVTLGAVDARSVLLPGLGSFTVPSALRPPGPPLFLLHASLLI